jgi:thiol-disulfide isomerase/thioredoxin
VINVLNISAFLTFRSFKLSKVAFVLLTILLLGCNREVPTQFSTEALNDTFVTIDDKEVTFKQILEIYKGENIFVDVWASWCSDCLKSLPQIKELQKENPDMVFLFLSVDKKIENWKNGITKYKIYGEHYFVKSGWDGDFGDFIDLDWTPRYMIIDKEQNIKLFEAVKTNDKKLKEALQ